MSDLLVKLMVKLKEAQTTHALKSTLQPAARDEYEFGRVCGFSQGLEVAVKLAKGLLDDRDEDHEPKRQKNSRGP